MKRRIISVLLTMLLLIVIFPAGVFAAEIPTSWKAPGSLVADYTSEITYSTSIYFSVDSKLLDFIDDDLTDHDALGIDSIGHTAQIDWKLNDGNWHYTQDWDTLSGDYSFDSGIYDETGYLDGETTQEIMIFDLRNGDSENTALQTMLGSAMIRGTDESGEDNRLDLENNTFYFRVRLIVDYNDSNLGEDNFILSPWSEILAYGKNATALVKPTYLETPTISNPVVGKNDDGSPKITFTVITPKQVQDANNYIQAKDAADIEVQHQININGTGWIEGEAGVWWLSGETRSISVPTTDDNGKVVEVDKAYIQVRMRYAHDGSASVGAMTSEWSNVISVNTPSWSNASAWATKELQNASDLGLIPAILKGADMTKPITREEFCELAVLLYEKTKGETAEAISPNPFTDTKNVQILKAAKLGITTGTTTTTFSPKVLINREQCAAMLFRAIKAINPDGDYSIAGVKDFPDQKYISGYAVEATKYMSKMGIIAGDAKGNFMPKATTSAQEATGYGMATREAAIALSVRTYEKIK